MDIRIIVVSLCAEDIHSVVQFYRDVIGLPLQTHFAGDHPHFDLGGTYLTIRRGHPALQSEPEPRFPVIAFSTSDLDAAVEKLRSRGVILPWGVETNASTRWVMFHDPAGNLIELMEPIMDKGTGL